MDNLPSVDFVLKEIVKIRFFNSKHSEEIENSNSSNTDNMHRWSDLFSTVFLCSAWCHLAEDDILFFVQKSHGKENKPSLRIIRRCSPNLPRLQDVHICWEKSVYLNLIMHSIAYVITLGICTRSGANEIEILNKISHKAYASPNYRQMDCKGTSTFTVYPHIVFHVDNFDEVFADFCLRDSECLCVELTAFDHLGALLGVIFEGVVRYSTLKTTHESQVGECPAQTWNFGQRKLASKRVGRPSVGKLASSKTFVRMLSRRSESAAELAVWSQDPNPASSSLHPENTFPAGVCEPGQQYSNLSSRQCKVSWDNRSQTNIPPASSKAVGCQSLSLNSSPIHKSIMGFNSTSDLFQSSLDEAITSLGESTSKNAEEARVYVPSEIGKIVFGLAGYPQPPKDFPASPLASKNFRNIRSKKARSDSGYLNEMPDCFHPNSRKCFDIDASNFDDVFDDLLRDFSKNESVDQAWNWFQQRRRIISPVLHVAVTYISIPWPFIISGISEVRKSPVLTLPAMQ